MTNKSRIWITVRCFMGSVNLVIIGNSQHYPGQPPAKKSEKHRNQKIKGDEQYHDAIHDQVYTHVWSVFFIQFPDFFKHGSDFCASSRTKVTISFLFRVFTVFSKRCGR